MCVTEYLIRLILELVEQVMSNTELLKEFGMEAIHYQEAN